MVTISSIETRVHFLVKRQDDGAPVRLSMNIGCDGQQPDESLADAVDRQIRVLEAFKQIDVTTEIEREGIHLAAVIDEQAATITPARDCMAHKGDPCWYCNTPHDNVEPGSCPGFTGEFRPPKAGERFVGSFGVPFVATEISAGYTPSSWILHPEKAD